MDGGANDDYSSIASMSVLLLHLQDDVDEMNDKPKISHTTRIAVSNKDNFKAQNFISFHLISNNMDKKQMLKLHTIVIITFSTDEQVFQLNKWCLGLGLFFKKKNLDRVYVYNQSFITKQKKKIKRVYCLR